MDIEFAVDTEDDAASSEWWPLQDLLNKVTHKGKPLFRAIASLGGGVVMTIMCTGNGREETLPNIATSTAV